MNKKTKAIHGEVNKKYKFSKGIASPINMSASFSFNSIKESEETFIGENEGYVYSRGRNPNLEEFEEKMTILEEGSFAVSFGSGMGAIATLLLFLLNKDSILIANHILYGSSYNLIKNLLPKYDIETKLVDLNIIEKKEILRLNGDKKVVIYFETPVNPTLEVIDIRKIREKFGEDATIIVDNTFATPILQNPLTLGADFVVHSCTKYIGGHGDAIGGIVVGKDKKYSEEIRYGYMCEFGSVMSPFNAWLFNRGLKTLDLRMKEHMKNALEIVKFLRKREDVEEVYYPGFGGMVSFTLKKNVIKFVESLKVFTLGVSLGDVESLVELPFKMTHRSYDKKDVNENLIRISVGLEDLEDLIEDLKEALNNA